MSSSEDEVELDSGARAWGRVERDLGELKHALPVKRGDQVSRSGTVLVPALKVRVYRLACHSVCNVLLLQSDIDAEMSAKYHRAKKGKLPLPTPTEGEGEEAPQESVRQCVARVAHVDCRTRCLLYRASGLDPKKPPVLRLAPCWPVIVLVSVVS
jgi:hypothetical protein